MFLNDLSSGFQSVWDRTGSVLSKWGDSGSNVVNRVGHTLDVGLTSVENIATGIGNSAQGLGSLLSSPIVWIGGIVLVVAIVPKIIK
jgi:hypothetical protein